MTSSYAHVMERRAVAVPNRLESPITANVDNLQAKKNFSVSHLLDLEDTMVGAQADESVGETRTMLESPGLTSGSDTAQPESKCSLELTLNTPGSL
ncbi:paired mesoderm homeobox protein 1b isoform X1 [Tachysurus ichikawai]